MAYTDSAGNVFQTNEYGRPQGYWKNNKYVFPKFGNQPAAAQPVIVEPQAAMQPQQPQQNNFRLPNTTANMQQNSEGMGPDNMPTPVNLGGDPFSLNVNPAVAQGAGSLVGKAFGPLGSLAGGAIGGKLGGRGNRGIGGDIAGTVLGTALLGPIGGLLGYAGGRMGDLHDMEGALGFKDSKTSGLLDTLGYGFGFGDNMDDRMRSYYEVDQYAPANVQPVMGDSEAVGDPFDAIAEMFSVSQGQDDSGYGDDGASMGSQSTGEAGGMDGA
jgi:hypothetical protein